MNNPTLAIRHGINQKRIVGAIVLAIALVAVIFLSFAVGARSIPFAVALDAVINYDNQNPDHVIIYDLRIPRTYVGLMVGICLGIAGAIMQGLARNPLADPSVLGVNAGASFSAVIGIWLFGFSSIMHLAGFAFVGAGLASMLVYALGTIGGKSSNQSLRLILAGTALNAILFSVINAILTTSNETLDVYRFWSVGSLQISKTHHVLSLLPFMIIGIIGAVWLSRALNSLLLGDDTARGLGENIALIRGVALLSIALLCATAVAIAGPIAFIGLVIPHIARLWCGQDQRWIFLYAPLLGGIFLLGADIIGRISLPPEEVEVGIIVSLLGGPVFIALVRSFKGKSL